MLGIPSTLLVTSCISYLSLAVQRETVWPQSVFTLLLVEQHEEMVPALRCVNPCPLCYKLKTFFLFSFLLSLLLVDILRCLHQTTTKTLAQKYALKAAWLP